MHDEPADVILRLHQEETSRLLSTDLLCLLEILKFVGTVGGPHSSKPLFK